MKRIWTFSLLASVALGVALGSLCSGPAYADFKYNTFWFQDGFETNATLGQGINNRVSDDGLGVWSSPDWTFTTGLGGLSVPPTNVEVHTLASRTLLSQGTGNQNRLTFLVASDQVVAADLGAGTGGLTGATGSTQATLNIANLPGGKYVLSFDILAIDSLDGNTFGPPPTPPVPLTGDLADPANQGDFFRVYKGGQEVFSATFSNVSNAANSSALSTAGVTLYGENANLDINTTGSTATDAGFNVQAVFGHGEGPMSLQFLPFGGYIGGVTGSFRTGSGEVFSIDNLQLAAFITPEPSSIFLMALGLVGVVGTMAVRRRRAA